jgi:hypothetical protein
MTTENEDQLFFTQNCEKPDERISESDDERFMDA